MKLLAPLGLLGLLSIIVLIIIYIIRPNFQQKFVSTTFIWKLSLKYKKKTIPISKLRNILLVLCQILILSLCAAGLARPVEVLQEQVNVNEVIAIIDSSASMLAETDGQSRFDRALNLALTDCDNMLQDGGIVSVIMAEATPNVLVERINMQNQVALYQAIGAYQNREKKCFYGTSDIEAAVERCADMLVVNPSAKIYIYTDNTYFSLPQNGRIEVESVNVESEWNAAILNANAKLEDGYYTFTVEVASYHRDTALNLKLEVYNANAVDSNSIGALIPFEQQVNCRFDQPVKVVFLNKNLYDAKLAADLLEEGVVYYPIPVDKQVHSYQRIFVEVDYSAVAFEDSFPLDDTFYIYGGQKPVIDILYSSTIPNPFWEATFAMWKREFGHLWDIHVDTLKQGTKYDPETHGSFDLYVFEHQNMPSDMPSDGVVVFCDPQAELPNSCGISFEKIANFSTPEYLMGVEVAHPIMQNVDASRITAHWYAKCNLDADYKVLMAASNDEIDPIVAVKNSNNEKVALIALNLHYSNFASTEQWPIMMLNFWRYFFPSTVKSNSFEVNESVLIEARGVGLKIVMGNGTPLEIPETTPFTIKLNEPGTYTISQTLLSADLLKEDIFVKIPAEESNLFAEKESLEDPYVVQREEDFFNDLLFYIAIALEALLFIEWWLQSRDTM